MPVPADVLQANHSMNEGQIGWFRAGSALNLMAQQSKAQTKSA
jgi:aconitate hydratase